MGKLEMLQWGPDRLRVGPWRGDTTVAQVVSAPGSPIPPDAIDRRLRELAAQGYRSVFTTALPVLEQLPYFSVGFQVHERLHLLRCRLRYPLPDRAPTVTHHRGRRRDRPQVLQVDAAAFEPFWQFDDRALSDARSATPSSRFRVVVADGAVVGYAITGRSSGQAYLQRLAVLPAHQGQGIGTTLVHDAFQWSLHHRCSSILVNTQETNTHALELYEHLGFVPEPTGLAVLHRELGSTDTVEHHEAHP